MERYFAFLNYADKRSYVMKEKAVTLLFISILASSALAANSIILTDKLINGSFEQPQLGEPVANWNYEGPAYRQIICTDFEPQEGNYSGRSLATWYGHDLPDAHLWQQIKTSQDDIW